MSLAYQHPGLPSVHMLTLYRRKDAGYRKADA
jgi:hypothetical protein